MKNLVVEYGSRRFRSALLSLATSTALAIGAAAFAQRAHQSKNRNAYEIRTSKATRMA